MTVFALSVAGVLIVSALCSLAEAALYAVRMPYVKHLAEQGSSSGKELMKLKNNMEQPISAILILNTAANTAGAAIAGAEAVKQFGEGSLFWFSVSFTVAVLFFSEILPKVGGVAYCRSVAPLMSIPLSYLIKVLYPVVWATQKVSRVLRRRGPVRIASEEELAQFAAISAAEGSILKVESDLVRNVLALDQILVRKIMTPRTVVFKLPADQTVREVADQVIAKPHARIPIFEPGDPDNWAGIVLKTDVLAALANDRFDVNLRSLAKTIRFVPDTMKGHQLLNESIVTRQHLLGVVDEYGAIVGVVCLEDVLESLIGREIVDETDADIDMQAVARRKGAGRLQELEGTSSADDSPPT